MMDELMQSTVTDYVSVIIAGCSIGAFIDFYIGKPGVAKTRIWLEHWWIKFACINIQNIGREESLFALNFFDKFFGANFISIRRCTICVGAISLLYTILYIFLRILNSDAIDDLSYDRFLIGPILISMLFFSISVSITMIAAKMIIENAIGYLRSFAGLIILVLLQYFMLCYWTEIVSSIRIIVFELVNYGIFQRDGSFRGIVQESFRTATGQIASTDINVMNQFMAKFKILSPGFLVNRKIWIIQAYFDSFIDTIPTIIRFAMTAIFVFMIILLPIYYFLITVWARLVEEDKPVFTIFFAGIAGALKIIIESFKAFHFSQ